MCIRATLAHIEMSKLPSHLEEFLHSISFDERLATGQLPSRELKKILRKVLKLYFAGKTNSEFVIALASTFYHEGLGREDNALMTAECLIDDLRYGEQPKKPERVKSVLRRALSALK